MNERYESDMAQEWHDQERALHEERVRHPAARTEPRVAEYRLLARILSEPETQGLPDNFATLVAARVEAERVAADETVERWGQRVLGVVLALAAIAFFGADYVAMLRSLFVLSEGAGGEHGLSPAVRWACAIGSASRCRSSPPDGRMWPARGSAGPSCARENRSNAYLLTDSETLGKNHSSQRETGTCGRRPREPPRTPTLANRSRGATRRDPAQRIKATGSPWSLGRTRWVRVRRRTRSVLVKSERNACRIALQV